LAGAGIERDGERLGEADLDLSPATALELLRVLT
jgi:hypothetical protein